MEQAEESPGQCGPACPPVLMVLAVAAISPSSAHSPPLCGVSRTSEPSESQGSLGSADEYICLGKWLCGTGERHGLGHMVLACPARVRGFSEVVLFWIREHLRFREGSSVVCCLLNSFFSFSFRPCDLV